MSLSSRHRLRRSVLRLLFFLCTYLLVIGFFPQQGIVEKPAIFSATLWMMLLVPAMLSPFLHVVLIQLAGLALVLLLGSTGIRFQQIDYTFLFISQIVIFLSVASLSYLRYERDALRHRLNETSRLMEHLEGEKLIEVKRMLAAQRPAYFEELTVLFSDIRNFSGLAEILPADRLYTVLNSYYSGIVRIVREHHGVIDKFLGDGIMVVFGLKQEKVNPAEMAVRCALRMLDYQKNEFAIDLPGGFKIQAGFGIATGRVMVGLVGGRERFEWTCLGDAVNLAARLERMTRELPSEILVSETTWLAIRDIPDIFTRTVAFLTVRGRFTEEAVIEVAAGKAAALTDKKRASRDRLKKALMMRRHGHADEANRIFHEIAAADPDDEIAAHWLNDTRRLAEENKKSPESISTFQAAK